MVLNLAMDATRDAETRPGLPLLSGGLFVAVFLASAALLGDILGSFGDPDEAFVRHYAGSSRRIGDIIGSLLLGVMGALFVWHVGVVRGFFGRDRGAGLDAPLLSSVVFATMALAAASALATVPLGREIGNLFDEGRPRLEGAEVAVPAHLGYVLLFGAGGMAAAVCVFAMTVSLWRAPAPRWLAWVGIAAVVLLPFSTVAFMPFMALPMWVAASAVATAAERSAGRAREIQDTMPPRAG